MKRVSSVFLAVLIILLTLLLGNCKKDESTIGKHKVTGHVQKGPYINGTAISMFELNESLEQTGKIFTTEISNNIGSFEINNVSLTTSYVEFSASGYYFDEVKGILSIAPLTLFALSDITDISTVNVNILTHLEKIRVEHLVKQDKTLSEAKNIALKEILAIFDFSLTGLDKSETLDISVNSEGNAILLAISIILQGNRSVGDLTELLANITNDIREDGILNNSGIMSNLRNSTKELSLTTIRTNLQNRYQELGISASIPDFEKYINDFLVFTGEKPTTSTQQATNITTTSATLKGIVNANSLSTKVIFQWGLTTSYSDSIPATQSPVTGSTNVNVSADKTGLLPGTVYHFRIKTVNILGVSYGNDLIFTTLGQVPSATTLSATNLTTTSATLNGNVNANELSSIVMFEYGTSASYGIAIPAAQSPVTGSSSVNVSVDLTGLLAGTTYHFRIKTENLLGTTFSNDLTFTTAGQVPSATTQAATYIGPDNAVLNGIVNANSLSTIASFEYGTTNSYGNITAATQSPVTGSSPVNVSVNLVGLLPGTTYYFRLKTENSIGTTFGSESTFTTLGESPTPVTLAATNLTIEGARINGTVKSPWLNAIATFEWGTTNSYGNTITATQNPVLGILPAAVSADITGLSPGTTYHYRIKAENAVGVVYSDDIEFTTLGLIPQVTTQPVTNARTTTAQLSAVVNANSLNTIVTFEYGTTTSYGNAATAVSNGIPGSINLTVSVSLSGLTRNTTYYVRTSATNILGTTYGNEISFKTAFVDVGENYQGGRVVYVLQPDDPGYDSNVAHGLIAHPMDIDGLPEWGCFGTTIAGADGTAIGTGTQNTMDIVASCTTAGIAAKLCSDLVSWDGYSDWYLPSKDELNKAFLNSIACGCGFANNLVYWSSSEINGSGAFTQFFGFGGSPTSTNKNNTYRVRAFRNF